MDVRWQKRRFYKTDYVSSAVKDEEVITKLANGLLNRVSYSSTQKKCVFNPNHELYPKKMKNNLNYI
jgi:hypothetical protein